MANSLSRKESALMAQLISSMAIMVGRSHSGTPAGTKSRINWPPWWARPVKRVPPKRVKEIKRQKSRAVAAE